MRLLLLFLILTFGGAALSDAEEARCALVIGCDYRGSGLQLPSPVKDAEDIAQALQGAGFASSNIELVRNPDRPTMLAAIERFGVTLSKSGGVGFFYFSGHGCQHEGVNFLLPARASVTYREDLPTEAVSAQRIVSRMEAAKNRVNLLFLDACRTNELPSARIKSSLAKGLASMSGSNILIGFAAKENTPSFDSGRGSYYTNALVKHLATPGIDVFTLLTKVRQDVKRATEDRQEPFLYAGLDDTFTFVPGGSTLSVDGSMTTSHPSAGAILRPKPQTTTRFNADLSFTKRAKDQLILGVKTIIQPDPLATVRNEVGMDFRFRSIDTPAKLVFRAQAPDYPLIISVRFPELGRRCDLPDSFSEGVKQATGSYPSDLPRDWRMQATMYDFDDDENPELVVALNKWDAELETWGMDIQVFVYSFRPPALEEDLSRKENWQFAGHVSGQSLTRLNQDEVHLPYGSQGLFTNYIYRAGYLVEEGSLAINKNVAAATTTDVTSKSQKTTAVDKSDLHAPAVAKLSGASLEARLRQLAVEYFEASSSPSVDREIALYAEQVDYYGEGIKSIAYIREDTKRQRASAQQRSFQVLEVKEATVDAARDQGSVTVEYRYEMVTKGKKKEGKAESRIVFRTISVQPKVIFVNDVKR